MTWGGYRSSQSWLVRPIYSYSAHFAHFLPYEVNKSSRASGLTSFKACSQIVPLKEFQVDNIPLYRFLRIQINSQLMIPIRLGFFAMKLIDIIYSPFLVLTRLFWCSVVFT